MDEFGGGDISKCAASTKGRGGPLASMQFATEMGVTTQMAMDHGRTPLNVNRGGRGGPG